MTEPRTRLLEAARAVLEHDGLEGLTLRAIARKAGVSHGAPLRHFPHLAALLAALSTQGFRELIEAVDEHITASPDQGSGARIRAAGAGYVHFAVSCPGVFGLMFRPELCDTSDDAYLVAAAASFAQLEQLVAAAQADGWRTEAPTAQLAATLWAQVHGLAQLWIHGALPAVVPDGTLDDLIDLSTGLAFSPYSPGERSAPQAG